MKNQHLLPNNHYFSKFTMQDLTYKWARNFNSVLVWLLTIASLLILGIKYAAPITSVDLWWHMAFGKHILNTGELIIDHSIFTWTKATPYHVYNAWLADVVLYLIHSSTGIVGLIILRYVVHGSFFALATYFAIQIGVNTNPLAWVIISLGTLLSFVAVYVQPELFSFMFMFITVWLYFFIKFTGIRAWYLCYLFPVIIILWINSHGAFVLAAFFFLSIGIGELLNLYLIPSQSMPHKLRIHLFFALVLCIVALLINPFGYELPISLLNNALFNTTEIFGYSDIIVGFDPTSRHNGPPSYAIDYLIVAMIIFCFLLWQNIKNQNYDWVIIFAFVTYSLIFVQFLRSTYFLAPVFVFSSLYLLRQKEHSWVWPRDKRLDLAIAGVSILLISIMGLRTIQGYTCHSDFGSLFSGSTISVELPVAEAEFISNMKTVKRLGNSYREGGYLMYRLWPHTQTMIDSRYFPFRNWFDEYAQFKTGGDNSRKFVAANKVDAWFISHREIPLIDFFIHARDWTPLFIGPAGVVFGPTNTNSTIKPKFSPAMGQTDALIGLFRAFDTAVALRNWQLAAYVLQQTESIANNRPWCERYRRLAREMRGAIKGFRAFVSGDYKTTITSMGQESYFINSNSTAITAMTILAQRAIENNDYLQSRSLLIDALRLSPGNAVSLYNAAVADWQYKKAPTALPVTDDITWQFLVAILLTHKEKIPPQIRAYIINVATAMQNGALHTKPELISQ